MTTSPWTDPRLLTFPLKLPTFPRVFLPSVAVGVHARIPLPQRLPVLQLLSLSPSLSPSASLLHLLLALMSSLFLRLLCRWIRTTIQSLTMSPLFEAPPISRLRLRAPSTTGELLAMPGSTDSRVAISAIAWLLGIGTKTQLLAASTWLRRKRTTSEPVSSAKWTVTHTSSFLSGPSTTKTTTCKLSLRRTPSCELALLTRPLRILTRPGTSILWALRPVWPWESCCVAWRP